MVNPELPDEAARRQLASNLRAEAVGALSVTRDQTHEITSARQLRTWEDAARRILSLDIDDEELNNTARSMLEQAGDARRWIWVNQAVAAALSALGVTIGIGAAVFGGLTGNIVLATVGALAGSAVLGAVVLRYRRENWRIRAEEIAPLIWKPGI